MNVTGIVSSDSNASIPLASDDGSDLTSEKDKKSLGDARGHLSRVKQLLRDVELASSSFSPPPSRPCSSRFTRCTSQDGAETSKQAIRSNKSKPCVPSLRSCSRESNNIQHNNSMRSSMNFGREKLPKKEVRFHRSLPSTGQEFNDFHRSLPGTGHEFNEYFGPFDKTNSTPSLPSLIRSNSSDSSPNHAHQGSNQTGDADPLDVPFMDKVRSLQDQTAEVLPLAPRARMGRLRFIHAQRQSGLCPKTRAPGLPPVPPPPLEKRYIKNSVKEPSVARLDSKPRPASVKKQETVVTASDIVPCKPEPPDESFDASAPDPPSSNELSHLTNSPSLSEIRYLSNLSNPSNSSDFSDPPSSNVLSHLTNPPSANEFRELPNLPNPSNPSDFSDPPSSNELNDFLSRSPKDDDNEHDRSCLSLFSYPGDTKKEQAMSVMATTESVFPDDDAYAAIGGKKITESSIPNGEIEPHRPKVRQPRRYVKSQSLDAPAQRRGGNINRYNSTPHFQNSMYDRKVEKIINMKRDLEQRKKEHRNMGNKLHSLSPK